MAFYEKHKAFMFSAIYFFGWAAYATFSLDFVFYSNEVGFSNTEIGLLFAALSLTRIIFQPVFGLLCDYLKTTRKILLVSLTFAIILSVLLPIMQSKTSVVVVILVYSIFMSSFMPLLDNWIARECIGQERYHYGALRLWGSIGYAIVAYIYGKLTMSADVSNMYYGRAFFFVITFIFIYLYKNEGSAPGVYSTDKDAKPNLRALFKNKEYILLVIFIFIFCFPLNSASSFLPSLVIEKGGSNTTIGLFNSINALVEIPFFLFSSKLTKKVGPRGLMLIGISFVVIRMAGFVFASTIPGLMASHLCIAPYTSLFMPGFIFYIYKIAPKNTQAFAQTAIQAFSMGIAGMLGDSLGGYVIDNYGLKTMYAYGTIMCGLGVLFFILTSLWLKKVKHQN